MSKRKKPYDYMRAARTTYEGEPGLTYAMQKRALRKLVRDAVQKAWCIDDSVTKAADRIAKALVP